MDESTFEHILIDINTRLSAHTVILNESIKPSIEKIEKHLETSNGRLSKLEIDVINIKHEEKIIDSHINGIKHNCQAIQDEKAEAAQKLVEAAKDVADTKHKRTLRYMAYISAVFAFITIVNLLSIRFSNKKTMSAEKEINVMQEKVDSIIMRNGRVIKDISPEYY